MLRPIRRLLAFMKIHVSLRIFWLILIAFFASIALLVWFWAIPHGILEYNLAVNIFTSSLFMVLTVVFLNWLFVVREGKEWKAVKGEVYSMVQDELGILFLKILDYTENGPNLKISVLRLDRKIRNEAYFSELCKLKEMTELKLNTSELKLLLEDKDLRPFSDVVQNLSSLELKYSRFLPSELTLAIMKIQQSIRLLEYYSELQIKSEELGPMAKELVSKPLQEMLTTVTPAITSRVFKSLIEEIHRIHKMGIELSPVA